MKYQKQIDIVQTVRCDVLCVSQVGHGAERREWRKTKARPCHQASRNLNTILVTSTLILASDHILKVERHLYWSSYRQHRLHASGLN